MTVQGLQGWALSRCAWLDKSPSWHIEDGHFTLETGDRTDVWRGTYFGFERDTGHLLAIPFEGHFSAEATVTTSLRTLYDRSGSWPASPLSIDQGRARTVERPCPGRQRADLRHIGLSDWPVLGRPGQFSHQDHVGRRRALGAGIGGLGGVIGRILKDCGFRHVSVRPQHPKSDPAAQNLFIRLPSD